MKFTSTKEVLIYFRDNWKNLPLGARATFMSFNADKIHRAVNEEPNIRKLFDTDDWTDYIRALTTNNSQIRALNQCYDATDDWNLIKKIIHTYDDRVDTIQAMTISVIRDESGEFGEKFTKLFFNYAVDNFNINISPVINNFMVGSNIEKYNSSTFIIVFLEWLKTVKVDHPLIINISTKKHFIYLLASNNIESNSLFKLTKRIEFAPKAVRNIFLKK